MEMENLGKLAAALSSELASICVPIKEAARRADDFAAAALAAEQFRKALCWAEAFNRPLAQRYHHAKKRRTRKKSAKRITFWYQSVSC